MSILTGLAREAVFNAALPTQVVFQRPANACRRVGWVRRLSYIPMNILGSPRRNPPLAQHGRSPGGYAAHHHRGVSTPAAQRH
ncbi:hypothetical protein FVE88_14930 [Ectopseudomonas mendocina]|nr:hypothetical protein FVE88_14930 [Pseudomonas mendocina]